jgi:hypothetical protein
MIKLELFIKIIHFTAVMLVVSGAKWCGIDHNRKYRSWIIGLGEPK